MGKPQHLERHAGLTLTLHTHADAQRRRLRRVGKTRQSGPNVGARRLGQDEQYLTVREILFRARPQMVRYHASAEIFPGLGMRC